MGPNPLIPLSSYELQVPTPHPSLSLTAVFFDLRMITLKLQLFSKLELYLSQLSEGSSPWEGEQLRGSFSTDQPGCSNVNQIIENTDFISLQ